MVKVAVGLALEAELQRDNKDSNVLKRLVPLYANPDSIAVMALHDELVKSESFEDREVGLLLELALTSRQPDFDWREVVMDMQETELDLFNLAYLIETSEFRNEFRAFGLLDWMNSIGDCVGNIRSGNWVRAKINANRAAYYSLVESVEKIRKNVDFQAAVDEHRKATDGYFEMMLKLPCMPDTPEDRLDTILEVQELLIEFQRKYHLESPDRILGDAILYPIEKLGIAQDYIMNANHSLEEASYEIGLASEHLKEKTQNVQDAETLRWLNKLHKRIEFLFSRMPAKPWPVEGFGHPGVESRFEKKKRGRSSLVR